MLDRSTNMFYTCTTGIGHSGGSAKENIDDGIIRPASDPNAVQRRMIDRKYGMFIHFGINTFHDMEWTDDTKPAKSYAPTAIDTDN